MRKGLWGQRFVTALSEGCSSAPHTLNQFGMEISRVAHDDESTLHQHIVIT
jgi:hypothetical protein